MESVVDGISNDGGCSHTEVVHTCVGRRALEATIYGRHHPLIHLGASLFDVFVSCCHGVLMVSYELASNTPSAATSSGHHGATLHSCGRYP